LKTNNTMFQVIHCIVLLGVYQTYRTQSYMSYQCSGKMWKWYMAILSQYNWLASWGPSEAILRVVSIEVTVQNQSTSTEPSSARVVCNFGRIEIECWVVIHEFSPHFPQKGLKWMKVEARCHDCLYFLNPKTKNGIPRKLFSVPHIIIACKHVDSQGRLSYIGEVAKQTSLNNSRNGSRQNRSLDLNKTGDMPEGCLVEISHVVLNWQFGF